MTYAMNNDIMSQRLSVITHVYTCTLYLPAYVCVFPGQDVLGEGRGFEFILVKREIFDKKGWSVHSVE